MIRIGHSVDTHRLLEGEKLIIGGVRIPHYKGTIAHSDGDCLLHTVAESLLGALALGDLGKLFPDTSSEFKDVSSGILVSKVLLEVKKKGFRVSNIDSTINMQKPKLQGFIPEIRKNIADLLEIDLDYVSVKATTGENIGIIGREEAIVCESVVLVTNN